MVRKVTPRREFWWLARSSDPATGRSIVPGMVPDSLSCDVSYIFEEGETYNAIINKHIITVKDPNTEIGVDFIPEVFESLFV